MTGVRSLQNPNVATRQVAFYSGVTDGSGIVSFTFDPPFNGIPLVFPSLIGGQPRESIGSVVTESGATFTVTRPATDVLLGITLTLGEANNPVASRTINIAVIGI